MAVIVGVLGHGEGHVFGMIQDARYPQDATLCAADKSGSEAAG